MSAANLNQPSASGASKSPAPTGQALAQLWAQVQASPQAHDFFALLRQVEALNPQWPRLGKALRPRHEALRLGQDPVLAFAPAAVSSFAAQASGTPRLGQRFFGLFGSMGPLPLHLTEFAHERLHNHGDATFARFADQFHHRALLLMYRAWVQARPTVHLDRREDDAFGRWLGSLAGLGGAAHSGPAAVSVSALRHHVALLARGAKNAEGLALLLRSQLGVAVRVQSHVAQWLPMQEEDRTRLLRFGAEGSGGQTLGHGAVAGHKVWDRQFRFRLHLGPMSYQHYQQLLPGRGALAQLRDGVRHYVGHALAFDTVACLKAQDVPTLRLGVKHAQDGRLGWTTWLGQRRPQADRADLKLTALGSTQAARLA